MTDSPMHLLPPVLRKMAREVSLRAVINLVQWRGGGTIYVPDSDRNTMLTERLGLRAARWLIQHFPNEYLSIPRAYSYLIDERNRRIIAAYKAGRSAWDIAAEHGLTERHVRRILSGADVSTDDRQSALF